ncbi:hypothetical protein [Cryptosporidium parvum Iowa II]|uniref:Uncharacterized protein n=1 Tax=Cryptosporidium parvum (strain Iowa II) TaxID=353152 RepID=Q5CPU7_CRYPI|nr:hypothetical protein [Cryptosporidium parvum Iowa II]EAK87437.1 hypothetical protein cgd4_3960 [Cryptosporidium parvum Iowa II]WRK31728.1 Uncharacterized protein cpbgf_4003960 [Cryptosporidium parvum]
MDKLEMSNECKSCESYKNEINKLRKEIYNISKSNINSQRLLEEKYTIQVQQFQEENYKLKKTVQEYEEYKHKSEIYYEEVNNTLIVAKSKLKELHERITFLEKSNSELEYKYNEAKSLLSILVEHNNYNSEFSSNKIPIKENRSNYIYQIDSNSISI